MAYNLFYKIKYFFKKNRFLLGTVFFAFVFLGASVGYNYYVRGGEFVKFGSPDETANYTFAKLYAETGQVSIFEKYNLYADDIMRPRAFRSDYGEMKPVSFLGIILVYGFLGKIFGSGIIPFLTPIFASVGLIFFYLLIKKIFSARIAFYSSVLLAFFPPFFYYTARSMFHNVGFLVFLIISLFFVVKASQNSKFKAEFLSLKIDWRAFLYSALAGGALGLAVIFRSSELIWLAPLFVWLWLFNIRSFGPKKIAVFLSFAFLAILPVLYWNQILYSAPFFGGYAEMNKSILEIAGAGADIAKATAVGDLSYHSRLLAKIKQNIFHFGLRPEQSFKMLYYYFAEMFPFLFAFGFLGLIVFLQKFRAWKKKHFVFVSSWILISAILIIYYGSWEFYDNPDKAAHTIGNSYTRYWLPFYLGFLPFASLFIIRFCRALWPERRNLDIPLVNNSRFFGWRLLGLRRIFLQKACQALIFGLLCLGFVRFTAFGSDEGLIWTAQRVRNSHAELKKITELTESDSVIITKYHDKLLFPQRKVIVGLFDDENMIKRYARLLNFLPVYYYNFTFPQKDFDYLNEKKLKDFGFSIQNSAKITSDFTLYTLTSNSEIGIIEK